MTAVLRFHGAAGCVTGSCALIDTERARILVDCGLFQGTKTLKALNYEAFPFDPKRIDAVLLTHAHIDHSGLLPKLALAGFTGPIYATSGTRDLCNVMLADSGSIQELEVDQLNRRNRRRAFAQVRPIYTAADAEAAMRLFREIDLGDWIAAAPGIRARWWNAGHILGSTSIEVEISEAAGKPPVRLCFSGDIGPGDRDLADDPQGPTDLDHLIVESTYGGTERSMAGTEARRKNLADELKAAYAAGGPLLIPAFAVERTQELIVDLLDLMEKTEAPPGPIFLDSPLAIRASEVFLRRGHLESGENPFASLRQSRLFQFTPRYSDSRDIEKQKGWHVIIAASGMCDAGRVRGHLRRLLPREDATVMIVGFQAVGTLGRLLVEGHREVRIQGDEIAVRAHIRSIDVYSGHADATGLVRWIDARKPIAGTVFLDHGEPESLAALKARLVASGFAADRVLVAALDQGYILQPGRTAVATTPLPPRIPANTMGRLDWHNERVAFLAHLHRKLEAAPDDGKREQLLQRLDAALADS
ncbi:MAG: MBL fold metallo-hydrolase [Hyphomonadaceae bacterium]|nr:MBL fold metallo-hydrolase [Hyphomonadaceae bacterium]